jgi:glutamate N-acetyltransferase/amino-acid N-acetyltransferase
MSVSAAKGFRAAGVAAGLKSGGRLDVGLVVNDGPRDAAAAVYTANRCKANPVLWSERASADGGCAPSSSTPAAPTATPAPRGS